MRRVVLIGILGSACFVGLACSGGGTTFANGSPIAGGENETPRVEPDANQEEEEESEEPGRADSGSKKDAGKEAGAADAGKKDASAPKDGGSTKSDASTGSTTCVGQGAVSGTAAGVSPSAQSATGRFNQGLFIADLWPRTVTSWKPPSIDGEIRVSVGIHQSYANVGSAQINSGAAVSIVKFQNGQWTLVDSADLVYVDLIRLDVPSTITSCYGKMEGTFQATFGSDMLTGAFSVPFNTPTPIDGGITVEGGVGPSCKPTGASCSAHSQCCSQSCFIAVGECN